MQEGARSSPHKRHSRKVAGSTLPFITTCLKRNFSRMAASLSHALSPASIFLRSAVTASSYSFRGIRNTIPSRSFSNTYAMRGILLKEIGRPTPMPLLAISMAASWTSLENASSGRPERETLTASPKLPGRYGDKASRTHGGLQLKRFTRNWLNYIIQAKRKQKHREDGLTVNSQSRSIT